MTCLIEAMKDCQDRRFDATCANSLLTVRVCLVLVCIEGGTNVDNWDFEGLMNVVTEFQ